MKPIFTKEQWQTIAAAIVSIITIILIALGIVSCSMQRVITTQQTAITKGDTCTTMTTKTTETYTGTQDLWKK